MAKRRAQKFRVAQAKAVQQGRAIDPAKRAKARVILRVTKVSPRTGDSWLNKIPLQANMPYASRQFTVI